MDALVAIREQRVRDYATRHDKKADACKDEAVALFAAGSSVEQICAQLSLWPLKVRCFPLTVSHSSCPFLFRARGPLMRPFCAIAPLLCECPMMRHFCASAR